MLDLRPRWLTNSCSVVIPTYKRHEEVIRAIRSVLAQTAPPLEVLAVNDGPDPEKARRIAALDDNRVRFHEAPRRGNASATRNAGIAFARGDWIALLDDDDIWLPDKLYAQFAALERAGLSEAILAGREAVYLNGRHLHDRPRKSVPANTPVDQLLFSGFGGVNTSTIVAPTKTFREQPLDESLERHEDWSWMLFAGQRMPVIVADQVVCERRLQPGEGLSRPGGVEFSRTWYEVHRHLLGGRARAAVVTGILSRKAAHDGRVSMLPWLITEARQATALSPGAIARMIRPWLIPHRLRALIRNLSARI